MESNDDEDGERIGRERPEDLCCQPDARRTPKMEERQKERW